MDSKTKKLIAGGTAAELSQMKAEAADVLSRTPDNKDAQDVLDAINAELEARAKAEPKKVKVRAKEFVSVDGRAFQKDQEGEVSAQQYAALACRFIKLAAVALVATLGLMTAGAQNQPSQRTQYGATALVQTNGIALDGSSTTNQCIGVNSATNYTQTIPLTKYGDIGLQMSFKLMAAGTTAVTAVFDGSGDGVNWVPSAVVFPVTASGTTAVSGYTNVTLNSLGYLRLNYITNGNNAVLTNLNLRVVYKPNRYGN